jgi:hypothetical protein
VRYLLDPSLLSVGDRMELRRLPPPRREWIEPARLGPSRSELGVSVPVLRALRADRPLVLRPRLAWLSPSWTLIMYSGGTLLDAMDDRRLLTLLERCEYIGRVPS